MWNGSFCGCTNFCPETFIPVGDYDDLAAVVVLKAVISEGMKCIATFSAGCRDISVKNGGICVANASGGCKSANISEGGECWANASSSCTGTYQGTGATSGCCRGQYCPSTAPRCECPNHEKMDSSGNCIAA